MPDFPYINARVRAMRSRLLDAGRIEELLALPTLEAYMHALNNTLYARELQEALTRHTGLRAVDEALARNFYHTTTKILTFADGKARALIEIVLMRWDLANVRLILRAKHAGRSDQEVLANLVPAGGLSEVALREVSSQADVAGVVGALGGLDHPFAAPLSEGLPAYQESRDLLHLELRLDRFYVVHGFRVAGGRGHNEQVVRRLLEVELAATNLKTALKLQRAGALSRAQKLAFFIGGGIVTEDVFLTLADPNTVEQGFKALRVHGFPVRSLGEDLLAFERELDLELIRAQTALYLADPLGIDVVIAYLAMKYNEVVNLRLLAHSKALGIPRDRVRKEMVSV